MGVVVERLEHGESRPQDVLARDWAACSCPPCVKRSPQNNVLVLDSNRCPHSQACGRCGASSQRTVWRPRVAPRRRPGPAAVDRRCRGWRSSPRCCRTGARPRGHREEVVQRTALVRLEVRERDVTRGARAGSRSRRRLAPREELARSGVEQERLLVIDEELVEREPAGHHVGRNRRADPVDAVGDLVDARAGGKRTGHEGLPDVRVYVPEERDTIPAPRPRTFHGRDGRAQRERGYSRAVGSIRAGQDGQDTGS